MSLQVVYENSPALAGAVLGLLLFLATLYFVFGSRSSGKAGKGQPTVLIVGPSGAGKTRLYLHWQDPDSKKETVMSVQPNESVDFKLSPTHKVIDCPGNEKLQQFYRKYLAESNVKAIIFMLDAASGIEGVRESAKPLFGVLEAAETRLIPVLIAANKFDLFSALSVPKIKTILEQEIGDIRSTKSHSVPGSEEDTSWGESDQAYLGVDGKKFEFKDLETEVEVSDGSVSAGRIHKWEAWLETVLSGIA